MGEFIYKNFQDTQKKFKSWALEKIKNKKKKKR